MPTWYISWSILAPVVDISEIFMKSKSLNKVPEDQQKCSFLGLI